MKHQRQAGFTLVELLVVIGIIVILVGILVPTISRVRQNAYEADSRAFMSSLQGAIERYHNDFRAYPGPLPQNVIGPGLAGTNILNVNATGTRGITASENLALGLLGGLEAISGATSAPFFRFNAGTFGNGPQSFNPANPKRYNPYLERTSVSDGLFAPADGNMAFGSNDTEIPEFVDRYPDPMPVLYLRATPGRAGTGSTAADNPVVTLGTRAGNYDLADIIAYTGAPTGTGKDLKDTEYTGGAPVGQHGLQTVNPSATLQNRFPFDAYPALRNTKAGPGLAQAKQKDGFILIMAGRDRVYGTRDDITIFGNYGD